MKKKKYNEVNISLILQNMTAILIIFVSLGIMIFIGNNKNNKWILEGNKVSKKDVIYEIGDYFEYDETNNGMIKGLTNVKWKVLGVTDKGHILIVAASNVEEITLGSKDDLEKSKFDYINGDKKLNEISKKYAYGKNAISGRSINLDDINKITKISKEYLEKLEAIISYYWDEENNLITINESTNEKNISKIDHKNEFIWFDTNKNEWNINKICDNKTNENMTKIVTLKNTHIAYNYEVYDEKKGEYVPFMNKDSKEYNMLFKDDKGEKNSYFTSTKYINATNKYVAYGYNVIKNADINYNHLIYSVKTVKEVTSGVRPVIEIK